VHASAEAGFDELAITLAHAVRVRRLPAHHRDPFDRMLVAQAAEEGLTVVTRDAVVARYGVATLWE
jgi:PIN domain nuclease of toxin-antitoxin system